jgi:deferrochelatase/peroxidase EfeB
MREYRFSIGNTNTGEIGMSFSVKADTQPEAIHKANEAMQQMSDTLAITGCVAPCLDAVSISTPRQ